MLDLTTFETFKNIDLSAKIITLLNQYLINDPKIIKNLLILYNEGKKENLMSEITLKEMILILWEAVLLGAAKIKKLRDQIIVKKTLI